MDYYNKYIKYIKYKLKYEKLKLMQLGGAKKNIDLHDTSPLRLSNKTESFIGHVVPDSKASLSKQDLIGVSTKNSDSSNLHFCVKFVKRSVINEDKLPLTKTIIEYNNNKFIVYDDSKLIGGTKSRLLNKLLPTLKEKEIVYAGPSTGLAQVALAYNAKIHKKKATIFLSSYDKDKPELVNLAKEYRAKIIYPKISVLKVVQKIAKKYVSKKSNRLLLPFGLRNDENFELFRKALLEVLKDEQEPKRLWLVAGSGFLLDVLHSIWPNTEFMVVQVGKKIWPDQLENKKHQLFIAPEGFTENAKSQPPYNTVPWYDAKLWQFFEKYNEKDDVIWNVGSL